MELKPDLRLKPETPPASARPPEKVDVLSRYELRLSSAFIARQLAPQGRAIDALDRRTSH